MSDELPLHQHPIYTHCWTCAMWGVNLPNDDVCGNCGSKETTTYFPIEQARALYDGVKMILDLYDETRRGRSWSDREIEAIALLRKGIGSEWYR